MKKKVSGLNPLYYSPGQLEVEFSDSNRVHKGFIPFQQLRENCYSAAALAQRRKDSRPPFTVSMSESHVAYLVLGRVRPDKVCRGIATFCVSAGV